MVRLTPWIRHCLQQRLGRQMHIVHAECFPPCHQALPNVISSAKKSQPNAKPAMFIEQDTRFEFLILANQHRGTPSVCQRIGGDEVFRLRGEIVLLATPPAKLQNLRQVRMELPIADEHLLGLLGPQ